MRGSCLVSAERLCSGETPWTPRHPLLPSVSTSAHTHTRPRSHTRAHHEPGGLSMVFEPMFGKSELDYLNARVCKCTSNRNCSLCLYLRSIREVKILIWDLVCVCVCVNVTVCHVVCSSKRVIIMTVFDYEIKNAITHTPTHRV